MIGNNNGKVRRRRKRAAHVPNSFSEYIGKGHRFTHRGTDYAARQIGRFKRGVTIINLSKQGIL